jgi:hypothetical protein
MAGVLAQKHPVQQKAHARRAKDEEEPAEARQHSASVVVGLQLRHQGVVGHVEDAHRDPQRHQQHQHIAEQHHPRQRARRMPKAIEGGRGEESRGVHERMAPPPFRLQIVQPLADQGVDHRISDQRGHDRRAHKDRR